MLTESGVPKTRTQFAQDLVIRTCLHNQIEQTRGRHETHQPVYHRQERNLFARSIFHHSHVLNMVPQNK